MSRNDRGRAARSGTGRLHMTLLMAGVFVALLARPAGAIDWSGRWSLGVRTGLYLHADREKGGFRANSAGLGSEGVTVNLSDEPFVGFVLSRGITRFEGQKAWQRAGLTLEIEASRWTSELGPELGFIDRNASTRVELPTNTLPLEPDGDEEFRRLTVADVTLTPIFANALLHWGSARADFHAGLGLGVVLAEAEVSEEYAEFVADAGRDDVVVDDVAAVNLKLGSNVRLTSSGRWYLSVDFQFFATRLLGSAQQVSWAGTEGFFGQQLVDADRDGVNDTVVPADFRLVDPGRVRLDGALFSVGLRYRFGGGGRAAAE